ncbi:DUF5667 domain-containing protein [Streptomyces radicis]|uniref:DUF5667 domain-containing protein n=1 Tax=Streptomyces radicis TaxID=1750517 RepID=A0A3A9W9Q8_9ACTN|nr:DUF5667 domain-containing protein [Streptomyces radicis]RKN09805.1 hypothetical protein D7319_12245 [Streptomyces radicis]RKN23442.1 hypothetical protein D7318_13200 [Streptomyces radicis]
MIGSMSAHRRANAFAHLLDESRLDRPGLDEEETAAPGAPGREAPEDRREHAALLAVVERLAALPGPELSPGTRTAQRARLVAAMESAFAEGLDPAESPSAGRVPGQRRARGTKGAHRAAQGGVLARLKPTTRLTKGLAAGGLTVGVAAGAFGGVAAASTDALPGDTLYGFKRGMEDLRLDFADGDMDRGQLYLDHASRRMGEARRLLERGRSGPLDHEDLDAIRRALASMRDDAAEGHRLLTRVYEADGSIDPIRSLSAFADDHRDTWTHLRGRLPAPLWDVGVEVTDVFDAMEEEIGPLQSLLPERTESTSSADGSGGGASASQRPGGHASEHPATRPDPGTTHDQHDDDHDHTGADESEPPGDGLLDGGLLTPEGRESGPEASSPPGDTEPGRLLPEPDVTIPPLVEDLLPDLGLDPEEP